MSLCVSQGLDPKWRQFRLLEELGHAVCWRWRHCDGGLSRPCEVRELVNAAWRLRGGVSGRSRTESYEEQS